MMTSQCYVCRDDRFLSMGLELKLHQSLDEEFRTEIKLKKNINLIFKDLVEKVLKLCRDILRSFHSFLTVGSSTAESYEPNPRLEVEGMLVVDDFLRSSSSNRLESLHPYDLESSSSEYYSLKCHLLHNIVIIFVYFRTQ